MNSRPHLFSTIQMMVSLLILMLLFSCGNQPVTEKKEAIMPKRGYENIGGNGHWHIANL